MQIENFYQLTNHPRLKHLIQSVLLFIAYLIVGELGYLFVFYPEPAAHFWPVSGLTLACLLKIPKSKWSPFLLAIFFGEVVLSLRQGIPMNVALCWGVADTLEPSLAAFLICAILKEPIDITIPKHLGVFLFCCVFTPIAGALIAAYASVTWLDAPSFMGTFRTWWFAISLGEILVTPFIFTWSNRNTINYAKSYFLEGLILGALFFLISYLTFATPVTGPSEYLMKNLLMYLMLPLILWTLVRFEEFGVFTGLLLINIIAAFYTARGKGPFAYLLTSPLIRLVSLQTYLSFVSLSTMALTTFMKQRRRSEIQLNSIIENSTALIYVKDLHGKYLLINKGYEYSLNTSREKMIGRTDFDLFPRELALKYQENDRQVLREKHPLEFEEKTLTSSYISIKFPLCDANEEPYAVCGISTDITPILKAAEELKNAIRLRDDFIAIASHELRTPLTPLRLQIGLLRRYLSKLLPEKMISDDLLKLIDSSDKEINQIASLVENLLDVSNMTQHEISLHTKNTDLVKIIERSVERLKSEIEKSKCLIEFHMPPELMGEWDPFRIEQVMINLLTNAIKYGECKPVEIDVSKIGTQAVISVKDNGIGIRKDFQEKIFDRFERAVPVTAYGGMGLGLFIVDKIVKAHHGAVKVQSEEGKGSVFTVELPIH